MSTKNYEVVCCLHKGQYRHRRQFITAFSAAQKVAEQLLHRAHTSVTIFEVIRTAKAMYQPKHDAGVFCRHWLHMTCDLDHEHLFPEKKPA